MNNSGGFKFYSKYRLKLLNPGMYPVIKCGNKKFIFIHINKNAGSSINSAFGKKKFHLTVKELINLLGEKEFSKAIKFTVVRNPYDRVISQYVHRVKTNQSNMFEDNINLNTWIDKVYGDQKDPKYYKPQYKMFYTQKQWLTNINGEIRADYILKFEELHSDFNNFCHEYDLNIKLPHLNRSLSSKQDNYLNNESIGIIEQHFEEDFEAFEYNFLNGSL